MHDCCFIMTTNRPKTFQDDPGFRRLDSLTEVLLLADTPIAVCIRNYISILLRIIHYPNKAAWEMNFFKI